MFLTSDIKTDFGLIGSTEFFPLKIIENKIHPKILKFILLHIKFREKASFLRTGKSQSHPRIQRDDFFNIKIPKISDETALLSKIQRYETSINKVDSQIKTIQEIITNVLIDFKIINKEEVPIADSIFLSNIESVAKQKYLRLGARYNDFWNNHKGCLFSTGKNLKPLKEFVKIDRTPNIKKGFLDKTYALIDFDQVESPLGIINNFENFVTEIGSDKVIFGECDLLTNKLRPYLGYTILNYKEQDLIGTTEFIPLKVFKKDELNPEYLRYLLLSKHYLDKSQFLSSGKEHPRISTIDLLNIQIPIPKISVQKSIVETIHKQEVSNNRYIFWRSKIRIMMDDMIESFFC